jgi:adenylosuccinate lyase
MLRHLERFEQMKPRLFTSMTGGAAGTFASLGDIGPAVQEGVAQRLGLTPMTVPARNIVDHFAEYVVLLGMVVATLTSIAEEVSRLMSVEFGEVSESLPEGDVGSSTMPQKRNAKKCGEVVIKSAQIRAFVPTALEAMIQSHEVDGTRSAMMQYAVEQSSILTSDVLKSIHNVLTGLEIYPERMKRNLELSGGLINAEAVMMTLAKTIGRQTAHEVVHDATHQVAKSEAKITFFDVLSQDPRVKEVLSSTEIKKLLDPATHSGLSAEISRKTSSRAYAIISLNRQ